MYGDLKILTGTSNAPLAQAICEHLGCQLTPALCEKFSDGESRIEISSSVRGDDVFVIQPTCAPVNFNLMQLCLMLDALKRASAGRITAVIPYYGYARQDRKAKARDPITAKLVANMLTAAGADRVLTMDLHASQIQGFFDIPVDNLAGNPIFVDYYKAMGFDPEELCVVSPDVGRAKAAKKFSTLLDCDIAIMHKDRPKHNQAEITALIGNVEGKVCILNDDMIDTAGSLVAAATTLKAKGAKKVFACATHGLFSGPAYDRIENSCIEEVVVTDAVPVPLERQTGKIKVLTLAPLFAQTIKNVYSNGSVASLFE